MKILLFGANGQVGWELTRALPCLGELHTFDRQSANFEQPDKLRAIIRRHQPTHIVNAAAYTSVDKAESEPEKAHRINAEAVDVLADEAKRLNALLVHYSTDYVFDGEKPEPYTETDIPNPVSIYGKTKLQGEEAVISSGCAYLIFRTSWVYSARGSNFAKTIFRLARERDKLDVIDDQHGVPTSAELIADVTALCIYRLLFEQNWAKHQSGIYHLAPSGQTSWYRFAKYLLEEALSRGISLQTPIENINPIETSQYPLPAKRPKNSRLNTSKLATSFGVRMPPWEMDVRRLVADFFGA